MTKEDKPLSSQEDDLARQMRDMFEKSREMMEQATYPCPIDGLLSTFVRTIGTYQTVVPVYRCPNGHEISVRLGTDDPITLLPSSSHGSTPNSEEAK